MTNFGKFKKANKNGWVKRHRVGIVKVSTTAGMFAGGFVGLGGAIMSRGMIPAELILVPAIIGGSIGANIGARKIVKRFNGKKKKR